MTPHDLLPELRTGLEEITDKLNKAKDAVTRLEEAKQRQIGAIQAMELLVAHEQEEADADPDQ